MALSPIKTAEQKEAEKIEQIKLQAKEEAKKEFLETVYNEEEEVFEEAPKKRGRPKKVKE